ncbi:MAG: hypothetical protein LBR93_10640 [Treponema sp.]|jgi:phage gp29-like protein|nr:hypothetical protein [Treponema sp.]
MQQVTTNMNTINKYDEQAAQYIPMMQNKQRGAIEGLVSRITEHTHAKPQRKRLIDDFIFSSLQPEFRQKMTDISESIIATLRDTLYAESEVKMNRLREGLENLKQKKILKKISLIIK